MSAALYAVISLALLAAIVGLAAWLLSRKFGRDEGGLLGNPLGPTGPYRDDEL